MVWSVFDNFFETPFGAIPFFLILGIAAAPLVTPSRANGEPPQPNGDPVHAVPAP
jgi:hypothetical protein